MDEVDGLIVRAIATLCDVVGISSVKQFSTELVVEAVVRLLWQIKPNLADVKSFKLPPSMTARFRVCTVIANAVKDLGFKGEIGYQTILYGNESEIRRVLIFLIEKQAKAESQPSVSQGDLKSSIIHLAATEIQKQLSAPWIPQYCYENGYVWNGRVWNPPDGIDTISFRSLPLRTPDASNNFMFIDQQQTNYRHLPASILEHLSRQPFEQSEDKRRPTPMVQLDTTFESSLANYFRTSASTSVATSSTAKEKKPKPKLAPKPKHLGGQSKTPATEENAEISAKADEVMLDNALDSEIEELRRKTEELNAECTSLLIQRVKFTSDVERMLSERTALEQARSARLQKFKERQKTTQFAAAPDVVEKLEELIAKSEEKMEMLQNEWDDMRIPLEQELKHAQGEGYSKTQAVLNDISNMKTKIADIVEEAILKDQLLLKLNRELEHLDKDINRTSYTKRILDIVANIRKQREEIEKILEDTRSVQREINFLTGRLERSFIDVDELIFRDAKQSEVARRAYKLIVALHEACGKLVKTAEDTGLVVREARNLEDQIDSENQKSLNNNLEKLLNDLCKVREENELLAQELNAT